MCLVDNGKWHSESKGFQISDFLIQSDDFGKEIHLSNDQSERTNIETGNMKTHVLRRPEMSYSGAHLTIMRLLLNLRAKQKPWRGKGS